MIYNNKFVVFFIVITAMIGFQCKSTLNSKSQKAMYREIYINQFKLTYLREMLIKSYNNSNAIRDVVNFDRSGFTEVILTKEDYKLIDSLTEADNYKMKIDSTNSIGRVAEGAEGKHILQFIVDKFDKNWLDSLAKNRYKKNKLNVKDFD